MCRLGRRGGGLMAARLILSGLLSRLFRRLFHLEHLLQAGKLMVLGKIFEYHIQLRGLQNLHMVFRCGGVLSQYFGDIL